MPRRQTSADASKRETITRELQRRVESGTYPPSGFLPPERVLAEEFGVSRPTLRSALSTLVRSGILLNQPGLGTRVASAEAVDGAGPRRGTGWRIVALLLPDITNRFFGEVTEAIEYTALQRGYQLLLCNSRHQPALEEMHIRQLIKRRVDGIILAHDPHLAFPSALPRISEAGIPAVILFSSPAQADIDVIMLDNEAGVNQVMRYLFSLGHRQIAFCRPVPGSNPHPREVAYLNFLRANAEEPPPHYVIPFEAMMEEHCCRVILKELFARQPAPTAIFAGNDRIALILFRHLATLGLLVPNDVSIVGFDNLRFSEYFPVPLTTVDQPKQEMGRCAVDMLLERIELGFTAPSRTRIFQPHLVIRDSCGLALPAAGRPVPSHRTV